MGLGSMATYDMFVKHMPQTMVTSVLTDLRQQMTKATFNTWLVDSHILIAPSTPAF